MCGQPKPPGEVRTRRSISTASKPIPESNFPLVPRLLPGTFFIGGSASLLSKSIAFPGKVSTVFGALHVFIDLSQNGLWNEVKFVLISLWIYKPGDWPIALPEYRGYGRIAAICNRTDDAPCCGFPPRKWSAAIFEIVLASCLSHKCFPHILVKIQPDFAHQHHSC